MAVSCWSMKNLVSNCNSSLFSSLIFLSFLSSSSSSLSLSLSSAKELSHTIVSLSMATSTEEDVASAPSAGFLCM